VPGDQRDLGVNPATGRTISVKNGRYGPYVTEPAAEGEKPRTASLFKSMAPATVRKVKKAQEIAKSFFAKNKPVASICHGPWLLVSADLVRGRHLTSYWHDGVPEEIKGAGGLWEDAAVVVDGNLVTSRWPPDLPAFTAEMIKLVQATAAV
jgi:transcriptional regulator GlxA family with amidase domain